MARPVVLSVNGERLELEPSGERLIDVIRDRTRFKVIICLRIAAQHVPSGVQEP